MIPIPRWPFEIYEWLVGGSLFWRTGFPISEIQTFGWSPDQIDPVRIIKLEALNKCVMVQIRLYQLDCYPMVHLIHLPS